MPKRPKIPKLGPTGDYPRGMINQDDEGGLMMAVSQYNDAVRVDFGKPIAWFAIPPDQALALASVLVKHAMELKGKRELG